jgi:uncharacterized protein DUF4154
MAFLTRVVRRLVGIIVVLVVGSSHTLIAQPTLEDDVKAAFLYNFTKFIEWPPPPQPDEPFRLCALADPPFIAAVDRTIADETVGGRRLVRAEPQSVDEARGCAILYIGKSAGERGLHLAAGVRDLPVLTVGEGPQFLKQGGAIGFVLDNNRVRFDISARSLQRSGLKASSKLLRVARTVEGGVS